MAGKIIIYGASGGIGEALTRRLVKQGASLHLVGRNPSRVEKLAESVHAGFTIGDVLDPSLFSRAAGDAGTELAGLVYAVGNLNLSALSRVDAEDLERIARRAGHDLRGRPIPLFTPGIQCVGTGPKKLPNGILLSVHAEENWLANGWNGARRRKVEL